MEDGWEWSAYLWRYRRGEWRAPNLHDMVLADTRALGDRAPPVVIDIECGNGFDGDSSLQTSLAAADAFHRNRA